jgi:hypothetical protein
MRRFTTCLRYTKFSGSHIGSPGAPPAELVSNRKLVLDIIDRMALGDEFKMSVMLLDQSGAENKFTLNNREFSPHRCRELIMSFLPDHLDTAYIAIWPDGPAAEEWLHLTFRMHKLGPLFLLGLLNDRSSLLPEKVINPFALTAVKHFCAVPQSEPLTIQHLIDKGLLTDEGKLHDDIHILAISGNHSFVAAQFKVLGLDPSEQTNAQFSRTVKLEPRPSDAPDYILRRVRCFIRRNEDDHLSLQRLAAAENNVERLLTKQVQMTASILALMRNAIPAATSTVGKALQEGYGLPEEPGLQAIQTIFSKDRLDAADGGLTAYQTLRTLIAGGIEDGGLKKGVVDNSCPLFVKLVLSTDRVYMQLYTFVKTYEMDLLPEFGAAITKQAMKAHLENSKKEKDAMDLITRPQVRSVRH